MHESDGVLFGSRVLWMAGGQIGLRAAGWVERVSVASSA